MKPLQERLMAYRRALESVGACEQVARTIPGFRTDLVDQLRRSSCSVAFNIAEGAREFSPKEKLRIYRIARREAEEALAVLDVIERVIEAPPDLATARASLNEVLALLTKTSLTLECRK